MKPYNKARICTVYTPNSLEAHFQIFNFLPKSSHAILQLFFGILHFLRTSLRLASEIVAVAVVTKYGRNKRERKLSIFQTSLNLRLLLKNFAPYTSHAIYVNMSFQTCLISQRTLLIRSSTESNHQTVQYVSVGQWKGNRLQRRKF